MMTDEVEVSYDDELTTYHDHTFASAPLDPADAAVQRAAERLRNLSQQASLDLHLAIGRIIVEELYQGDIHAYTSRDPKALSLRKLASEGNIGFSATVLSRSVAMYRLHLRHDLTRYPNLSAARLRTVIKAPEADQPRLLAEAAQQSKRTRTQTPARGSKSVGATQQDPPTIIRNLRKRLVTELTHLGRVGTWEGEGKAAKHAERALGILELLRGQLVGVR